MSFVRIERHPLGPRVHVGGRRLHHAHAGLLLILAGARLIWRDWGDRWWR